MPVLFQYLRYRCVYPNKGTKNQQIYYKMKAQKINYRKPITATHFYNYVKCPARVYLSYYGDESLKLPVSDFMQKKIEEGVLHEKNIISRLKVSEVKAENLNEAFSETTKLMRQGAELIYQGVLIVEDFIGRPDLLKKTSGKSRFGDYYYTAEDIKLGHSLKEEYEMQVTFYSFLLGKIQGTEPTNGTIIVWDGSKKEFEIDRTKFTALLQEIKAVQKGEKREPAFSSTCRECSWREYCLNYLKHKGDISLVHKLSRAAKKILNSKGIISLADLAKMDVTKCNKIKGISDLTLKRFKLQAKSLLKNKSIGLKAPTLPKKSLEIFFDIESDSDSSVRYLFGMLINNKYSCFLASTPNKEAEVWHQFIEFFRDKEDFVVYHYGNYEKVELQRLKRKYGCDEAVYSRITKSMVNAYALLLASCILPVCSYSLKDVAGYFGFRWKSKDASGGQSMFWYSLWLETGNNKWRDLILQYNEDDCRALQVVQKNLINLAASLREKWN